MIAAVASAKVNLSLRVGSINEEGLHRLGGIFQSVSWFDRLTVDWADEDVIQSGSGGEVVAGKANLAWRALLAVREAAGSDRPLCLTLDKSIPAAAGLGGGSADAAAALGVAGRLFGVSADTLSGIAAGLGSDVPFCLSGGGADVGGAGEVITARDVAGGYALGLVTPPVELATPAVFAAWDDLGGPDGPGVAGADLPPSLRSDGPLVNDLYPAAAALAPLLEDWRADLATRWGRPAIMTGSGPTLFGFFIDEAEAAAATTAIPAGARGAVAASPVDFGWAASDDGEVWGSKPFAPDEAAAVARILHSGL